MLILEKVEEIKPLNNPIRKKFIENGYIILKNFIPETLCNNYLENRMKEYSLGVISQRPTEYMMRNYIKELGLYEPLLDILDKALDGEVGLNLSNTDLYSTERLWHQDDSFNSDYIQGRSLGVIIVFNKINYDCGQFEYVAKSNNWGKLKKSNIESEFPQQCSKPDWIKTTEEPISKFYELQIKRNHGKVESFLGQKGDVFIYHSLLFNRNLKAKKPDLFRNFINFYYTEKSVGTEYFWKGRMHIKY